MSTMANQFVERSQQATSPSNGTHPGIQDVNDLFQWLGENSLLIENLTLQASQQHRRISIITFRDSTQATIMAAPPDGRIQIAEGSHQQPIPDPKRVTVRPDCQAGRAYFDLLKEVQQPRMKSQSIHGR